MLALRTSYMLERPFVADAAVAGAQQTVTMLCLLEGPDGSGYSHEYVSRTVLHWASEKFPRLVSRIRPKERSFVLQDERVRVDVHSGDDELFSWAFRCDHPDAGVPGRRWRTEVCLANLDGVDQLAARNSYLGVPDPGVKATQPRFLRPLVDHLSYRDGGIRVSARPLFAQRPQAFENFCDHLQARHRHLPLVILAPRLGEAGNEPRYGTNPWTLAQWLCGLAHVVAVADHAGERLRRRLGDSWTLPAGSARVAYPVEDACESPQLFEPSSGLAMHDALCGRLYAQSAAGRRARQFQALWSRCLPH